MSLRVIILVALWCLTPAIATGQVYGSAPYVDLSQLGLGPVTPTEIEVDGNLHTTEWVLLNGQRFMFFEPLTGCIEQLVYTIPDVPQNTAVDWVAKLVRIAPEPRHQIMVWDRDNSDGVMPLSIQPVTLVRCQRHGSNRPEK